MKIKDGRISILVGSESTTIQIIDNDACITFVSVKLTPEQLSMALSRLASTPCEIEVMGLDRVGKKHENSTQEFELPESLSGYDRNKEELTALAKEKCPEGWVSDASFNSQNSFFEKNGKKWARATIRRWI